MVKEFSSMLEKDGINAKDLIIHAIFYSKPADYIFEALDIHDLLNNGYIETCQKMLKDMIPAYEKMESFLGNPRTFEDWVISRNNLKTRKVSAWKKLIKGFSKWDYMTDEEKKNYK
jgi:hypothetical protein